MSTSLTVLDRPAGAPGLRPRGARPGVALAVPVTCQLMLVLDGTVVNIALPQIQEAPRFSATGLSWVLNAYLLPFGGLLLLGGRAGDVLDRRRVFGAASRAAAGQASAGGTPRARAASILAHGIDGAFAAAALFAVAALALAVVAIRATPARGRTDRAADEPEDDVRALPLDPRRDDGRHCEEDDRDDRRERRGGASARPARARPERGST